MSRFGAFGNESVSVLTKCPPVFILLGNFMLSIIVLLNMLILKMNS